MPPSYLTPLQARVLRSLADLEPPWTLTGGAALAGIHYGHRRTRDLDLFWHGLDALAELPRIVAETLKEEGLQVQRLQTSPGFSQLRVASHSEVLVVDLVADPVPLLEPPTTIRVDGVGLRIDTPYEILVNKLCTLLGRSEIRDLIDTRKLLGEGLSLEDALRDAPRKDAGFSVLTLAWVLEQLPVARLARAEGLSDDDVDGLGRFRDELVARLMAVSRPGAPSGQA